MMKMRLILSHWQTTSGILFILTGIVLILIFPLNGNAFNSLPASMCIAAGIFVIVKDFSR